MKKLRKPTKVIKKYIDILVNIDDYQVNTPIAANTDCSAKTFQPSIRKELKISDEALALYTNFLNGVLKVICNYELDIKRHYQSKKAYTYYIEVDHYGYIDDIYVKYDIQFRINNHINPTLVREPKQDSSGQMVVPVLKDIRIGAFESTIYSRVMIYLNEVCKGIKEDDENMLQTDMVIFNSEN